MIEKQNEIGYKRCPECFEIVGQRVKICPTCRSYQDWRRFVGIGQTNLALLVALLSLLTTGFTVGFFFLQNRGPDISLVLASTDQETSALTFLARNDGRSGGVIRVWGLVVTIGGAQGGEMSSLLHDDGQAVYVGAGKEERFKIPVKDGLAVSIGNFLANTGTLRDVVEKLGLPKTRPEADFYDTAQLTCYFELAQTGFHSERSVWKTKVDCTQLSWVREGLWRAITTLHK